MFVVPVIPSVGSVSVLDGRYLYYTNELTMNARADEDVPITCISEKEE